MLQQPLLCLGWRDELCPATQSTHGWPWCSFMWQSRIQAKGYTEMCFSCNIFLFFFFLVEIIYKVFSYRLLAVTTCSSNRKHYSEERAARYWSILAAPALQRKFCPTLSTENIFWKFMPKSDLKILSHILMLFLEFLFGVTSVADTFRYKDKAQNHKGLLPVPCHPF